MTAPMRRLVALLSASAVLALAAPPAVAQSPSPSAEPASVRLELHAQTPWVGPPATDGGGAPEEESEIPTVELRFEATNLADAPLGDLTIGLTLFGRVLSRSSYEQSLLADPVPAVVIEAETFAREGSIQPGASRTFEVSLAMDAPGIDTDSSGIYPLKVDLRSAGVPLAAIRTPVINLVREPEQPLAVSWTFVLHEPIAFRPDGVFTTTALEEALEPGGHLAGEIRALDELVAAGGSPVDVAVSPVLLRQLAQMRDGYVVEGVDGVREVEAGRGGAAAAADALDALRRIAASPDVSLSAMPFSAPQIPSLISGGLARDLDVQLLRGREEVGAVLERPVDPTVLRPPGGALDDATLDALEDRGIRLLALDPGAVESPLQPLGFSPPPVTTLDSTDLVGLVPDPAVSAFIGSPLVQEDPVLGAQVTLGELAAIWQELPGQARGISMVFPEDLELPGGFFPPFVLGVGGAPWLRPVGSHELVAAFPADDPSVLASPSTSAFGASYVAELKQTRRRIDVYRSMLVQDSPEPERLETQLLLAESGSFLSDPTSGFAFIQAASARVDAAFAAVRTDAGPVVTLTSRTGSSIPVLVTNGAEEAYRVSVALVSQYLRDPPSEDLVLQPGEERELTFEVDVNATGRFKVFIQVVAPAGRVLSESWIVVRSTAYSTIALIITVTAAIVLVLVWARRFLPRRTT